VQNDFHFQPGTEFMLTNNNRCHESTLSDYFRGNGKCASEEQEDCEGTHLLVK
jgi:hypothetical protein